MDNEEIKKLVELSKKGEDAALKKLVSVLQDQIYGIALRFLWNEEDATEATQEILIKVITHLSDFRGESMFRTWCFRIATNHLLDVKKSAVERLRLTQVSFEEDLHDGLAEPHQDLKQDPQYPAMLEEVRVGCTTAMLNCLDRGLRIAYIIGEILEIESSEASEILDITPVAFRKRLQRARKSIESFTKRVCGIIDSNNQCRCQLRLCSALDSERVKKDHFVFTKSGMDHIRIVEKIQELDTIRRVAASYRAGSALESPTHFTQKLRLIIDKLD
ncbi:MAG: RNA polymerase sigma factor [Bdellovibrionales bacterium]|nr:RNA polymerase sigma factor [Bdellovibrionales bacterium]